MCLPGEKSYLHTCHTSRAVTGNGLFLEVHTEQVVSEKKHRFHQNIQEENKWGR